MLSDSLLPASVAATPVTTMAVMDEHLETRSMLRWARLAEEVRATRRTSVKIALVADYLASLDEEALASAVVFLSGRPFPEREQRTTGLGWAAIAAVAGEVSGTGEHALRTAYDRSSDIGVALGELLEDVGHAPASEYPALSLLDVSAAFEELATARGQVRRRTILADLLRRADPLSAHYTVAILVGELRIGLREGHLEAGLAAAFGRPLADVQWAGMLTGDIGATARLARRDALGQARLTLFRPLKSMLASPVADEAEALARLAPPVWVEDKYDGIRAQLHKQGRHARLFSRDLNDITVQFPEVVRAAEVLPWDGILDGELLAWKDDAALPFLELQSRLGRQAPSDEIQARIPVIYVAFDALALGPAVPAAADESGPPTAPDVRPAGGVDAIEPLLRLPLRDRRGRLEALALDRAAGFGLSVLVDAPDAAALARIFDEAQARGNEGLMLKDPASAYTPGRRGAAWLKLKKALTTLDCVVVGVEVGHGRRHGVLSDYTFAVLDDRPGAPEGALATIGKAYSGLSDAEIAEMTRWFEAHTVSRHGRYRVVEPLTVVEIAFDVVHRSARHASGYALRFPRIVRLRHDKQAAEIDRLSSVAAIHERLQVGGRVAVLTAPRPSP
jgi:DNA ligase-1